MSRTIEALKKASSKDDILHENIISTYFYQKTHRKKSRNPIKKVKILFAFLLTAIFLLSAGVGSVFCYNYYLKYLKEKTDNSPLVAIFEEGHINREIIKGSAFRGSAKEASSVSRDLIVFSNPEKYNWANFSMDFRFPVDLSKKNLSFSMRGKIGGERMSIVIKDNRNKSRRLGDIYLASGWKTESIPLAEFKNDVNLSKITQMRFECGYLGEARMDSPIDVTVYIKDIKIAKEA